MEWILPWVRVRRSRTVLIRRNSFDSCSEGRVDVRASPSRVQSPTTERQQADGRKPTLQDHGGGGGGVADLLRPQTSSWSSTSRWSRHPRRSIMVTDVCRLARCHSRSCAAIRSFVSRWHFVISTPHTESTHISRQPSSHVLLRNKTHSHLPAFVCLSVR